MHAPTLVLCILKQQGAHMICAERHSDIVEKA